MFSRLRRYLAAIAIALIAVTVLVTPVLGYLYRAPLTIVQGSDVSYDMMPVFASVNNKFMASEGYMASDARDTRVQNSGGTDQPRMMTDNGVWTAVDIPALGQVNLYLVTGETSSDFDIITGTGGYISVLDSAALELGNNFEIDINAAYVRTGAGSDKDIIFKDGAFRIQVGTDEDEIMASIYNSGSWDTVKAVCSGYDDGEYDIRVVADVQHLHIYINSTLIDTVSLNNGEISVLDNSNPILINRNDACAYIGSIEILVDETIPLE